MGTAIAARPTFGRSAFLYLFVRFFMGRTKRDRRESVATPPATRLWGVRNAPILVVVLASGGLIGFGLWKTSGLRRNDCRGEQAVARLVASAVVTYDVASDTTPGASPVNTLYYGDNLDVLRQHIADESVDVIYLDPSFKSDQNYNVLF